MGIYSAEFWEAFIVEAHGLLLDILVIGIILFWFNLRKEKESEKAEEIAEMQNEIDDFRNNAELLVQNMIFKNIKKMQRFRVTKLDLRECYIEGKYLFQLNCPESFFLKAHLKGSKLPGSNFRGADFSYADLRNTILIKTNFSGASLYHAIFDEAVLNGVDFTDANICGAKLAKTNDSELAIWTGAIYDQNTKFPEWMTAEKLHELGMINSTRS